jgi:CHAD domain-containing protein
MARREEPDLRALAAAGAVAAGAVAVAAGKAARARARRRKRARRYRLGSGEPVPEGIRRIARGQLDLVAEQMGGSGDKAVHKARKAFKRLRALVRLTRDQLGADVRRRENAAFRDAGRKLSGARDARVLVGTLDELVAHNRDALQPGAFDGLRSVLVWASKQAAGEGGGQDGAEILAAVAAARERLDGWPLAEGMDCLAPGLERIHRRGRGAYRAARADPSSERLHELRKRTKDLWHAAQVLHPAAPKRLRKLARAAHELSDVLGADHDLATLLEAARAYPSALAPAERELLEGLIERRRAGLRRDALRRARRVYSPKPRKLARMVR